MALTSLSISPTLSAAVTPANISLIDNTDYAAAGYTTAGGYLVNGYIKVEGVFSTGTTVIYDNTVAPSSPDVQPLSSTGSLIAIPMPLDADGKVLPGSYVFTYLVAVLDSGFSIVDQLEQSFTYEVDFETPEVCLTVYVNCQDSKITSADETAYGDYTALSRVHTLYPPPASGSANIVGTTQVITTTDDIYTKTWTQGIASTVSYDFDGLTLVVLIEGTREFPVVCNTGISVIYCCIKKLMNKWNNLRSRNEVAYNNLYNDYVVPTQNALIMYMAAQGAGNEAGADYWYAKILEYSGCAEDGSCGCNDDSPQQVISAGSAASFVVDSPDNSIAVTQSISGSQITFHVQVSAAIQALLASLYARTITTTTPSYLQLTETGTGSNRNTQIDFLPGGLIAGVLPFISARFEIIAGGSGGNVATMTLNSINQAGNMFASAGSMGYLFGLSPNTNTDIAYITLYNFISDAAALDYTATANVMLANSTVRNTIQQVEAKIAYFDAASTTGVCNIVLYNTTTGVPLTVADILTLIGTGTLYVSLFITAKPR